MFSGLSAKYIENFESLDNDDSGDMKNSPDMDDYDDNKTNSSLEKHIFTKISNTSDASDTSADAKLKTDDTNNIKKYKKKRSNESEDDTDSEDDEPKINNDNNKEEDNNIEESFNGSKISTKYIVKIVLIALLITCFVYVCDTLEFIKFIKYISGKIKIIPYDVIHYGIIYIIIYIVLLIFD